MKRTMYLKRVALDYPPKKKWIESLALVRTDDIIPALNFFFKFVHSPRPYLILIGWIIVHRSTTKLGRHYLISFRYFTLNILPSTANGLGARRYGSTIIRKSYPFICLPKLIYSFIYNYWTGCWSDWGTNNTKRYKRIPYTYHDVLE